MEQTKPVAQFPKKGEYFTTIGGIKQDRTPKNIAVRNLVEALKNNFGMSVDAARTLATENAELPQLRRMNMIVLAATIYLSQGNPAFNAEFFVSGAMDAVLNQLLRIFNVPEGGEEEVVVKIRLKSTILRYGRAVHMLRRVI